MRSRRAWAVLVTVPMVLAACSSHGAAPASPSPSPSPSLAASRAPVGVNGPIGLAALGSDLWVVSAADGTVQQRDAATGRLVRSVKVGTTPLRVVATATLVWVSVFGEDRVKAIDPRTGAIVHNVGLSGEPEGLAVLGDQLWVVRQAAQLVTAVDADGTVQRSVPVGTEPRLDVAAGRYLVVANFGAGTLTRVDPATGARLTSGRLCQGPQGMSYVDGSVWVACTTDDAVLRVDPATLRVLASVQVPGEPDAVHPTGGGVLVTATAGPTLYAIDTRSAQPRVTSVVRVSDAAQLYDAANVDSVSAAGSTWISSFSENRIWRLPS